MPSDTLDALTELRAALDTLRRDDRLRTAARRVLALTGDEGMATSDAAWTALAGAAGVEDSRTRGPPMTPNLEARVRDLEVERDTLIASLSVPERYVGVVSDAVAEEIERLRARVREVEGERDAACAALRGAGGEGG